MVKITDIQESKQQELKDRLNRHKKGGKTQDIMDTYYYFKKQNEKLGYVYAWIGQECGMNAEAVASVIRNNRKGA